jgi:hypothetical protein
MPKARRQHSAGRPDRVSVRDRAALDIDDLLVELLGNGERNCGEGFVYLNL